MTSRTARTRTGADPQQDWVPLPCAPRAARLARRFLDAALSRTRPEVLDVVVLLSSELVTNAVLHGGRPVRLQLTQEADLVRVEVHDGGLALPTPSVVPAALLDEGGRGLDLVGALASSWGSFSDGAEAAGKTVWFEVASAGSAADGP